MINYIKPALAFGSFTILTAALISCNKENSTETAAVLNTSATTSVIAVATAESPSVAGVADSVYLVQPCARGSKRDSVSEAQLPEAVTSYLTTNYPGYSFQKAYAIVSSAGTKTGYVAIIYYNDNPAGIEFDSNGSFVKVLEQREKGDLDGRGWHHGGRFGDREKLQKDTVSLTSLPAVVLSYLSANYAGDTLVKAYTNRDSSYLVLSENNGVFATLFNSGGSFIKRVQLPGKAGRGQVIAQTALPSGVLSYLDAGYPNYVFKKAFSISENGAVKGYLVVIDANTTKYAVEFDASGNFVRSKTIW